MPLLFFLSPLLSTGIWSTSLPLTAAWSQSTPRLSTEWSNSGETGWDSGTPTLAWFRTPTFRPSCTDSWWPTHGQSPHQIRKSPKKFYNNDPLLAIHALVPRWSWMSKNGWIVGIRTSQLQTRHIRLKFQLSEPVDHRGCSRLVWSHLCRFNKNYSSPLTSK